MVGVGSVMALIMVFLGLWQMQVFMDEGNRSVEGRAAQPAVPLLEHVFADGSTDDIYGKQVTVTGTYQVDHQLTIPAEDGAVRVLTAFRLADGRVVPVVRGLAASPAEVGPAPEGTRSETGLFLPGEGDVPADWVAGQIGSVRMPLLAQYWPDVHLTPGFVTLDAAGAAAHGLAQAPVDLPQGEGSFQNGGYALQWWVFAAFAFGMSLKLAQGFGARDRQAREEAAHQALINAPGKDS